MNNQEILELRKWSAEVTKLEQMIQDYMVKRNENEMVKQEIMLLEESATIFKLIGPAMVRQSKPEAMANLEKRLEFITEKINQLGKLKNEFLSKVEEKKKRLMAMQQAQQEAPAMQT